MTKTITLANHDSKSILDVLALLTIVEREIDKLEYTGNYNAETQEFCLEAIGMIKYNVLKKLIEDVYNS